MEFGLGKNKQMRDENPTHAIINLSAYDENNTVSKVFLNKKAYEVLGLTTNEDNEIAFSTSKSDLKKTYLINANDYASKANIKVRKNGAYSNKNNFTVLKKRFNTELIDELLLEVVPTERVYDGQKIFEVVKFIPEEKTEELADLATQEDQIQ